MTTRKKCILALAVFALFEGANLGIKTRAVPREAMMVWLGLVITLSILTAGWLVREHSR